MATAKQTNKPETVATQETKFSDDGENYVIVFDIETQPLSEEEIVKVMPKFEAPSNIKDQVKIAEAIGKKQTEFVEKAALSPYTGKISLLSYSVFKKKKFLNDIRDDGLIVANLKKSYEAQLRLTEKEIISKFFQEIAFYRKNVTLVGFNVRNFDLPFIVTRALKNNLSVPFYVYEYLQGVKKYEDKNVTKRIIDLMPVATSFKYGERISLNNVCKFFGLGEKSETVGKQFYQVLSEDRETAYNYAANDIVLTSKLYGLFFNLLDANQRSI